MFKESRPSGLNHTAGSTSESAQIATASHAMRRQALLSFIGMPTHTDSGSGGCAAAARLTPWHACCLAIDLMLSRISTIAVFFLVALEISSCNDDCSGTYNCPLITMSISVPADISVRVRSATGDTCTPTVDAGGASIGITSTTMHPCLVRVVLDDGSVEESRVTFAQLHCCGYMVEATPFEAADGGATGG